MYRNQIYLFSLLGILFMNLYSCKKNDDKIIEEDPYTVIPLPPVNDAIPYEVLGKGKIVFDRINYTENSSGFDNKSGFHVIDIDKKTITGFRLNGWPWPSQPNISPDGTRIVCTMFTVETAVTVSLMNIDGTNCHPVRKTYWQPHYPSWTPDGSKILFYDGEYGDGALYMQSPVANANDTVVLTNFRYEDDPEWAIFTSGPYSISQDQKLVCVSSGNRPNGILTIDPYIGKSGVNTLLSMSAKEAFESPSFSPDGQKIAFLSIEHDSLDLYGFNSVSVKVMNRDGTNINQLVKMKTFKMPVHWVYHHRSFNVSMCWSPDGTKILFTAPIEEYGCHLFVINSDGSGLTQVTDNINAYDVDVSWSR